MRYRPFIADILRYDFQIEEAVSSKASVISETLALSKSSHSLSKVLKLSLYIWDRYLAEESEGFCEFEDHPEVRESIQEKYENLEENLD